MQKKKVMMHCFGCNGELNSYENNYVARRIMIPQPISNVLDMNINPTEMVSYTKTIVYHKDCIDQVNYFLVMDYLPTV